MLRPVNRGLSGNLPGIHSAPQPTSFIVKIEPLRPNYEIQERIVGPQGFWAPPDHRGAYHRDPGTLFRWRSGTMALIAEVDTIHTMNLEQYRLKAATVFSQFPDTHHLLAVDFDAEIRSVMESQEGWRVLSFRHIQVPNSDRLYSLVDLLGDEQQLAAPVPQEWINKLIPCIYKYDGCSPPTPQSAGIIGDLCLLLSLAAFSAPLVQLNSVLTQNIQPGVWLPHTHRHGYGGERGMVVTIYRDPFNLTRSTVERLENLEKGVHGPFYYGT